VVQQRFDLPPVDVATDGVSKNSLKQIFVFVAHSKAFTRYR